MGSASSTWKVVALASAVALALAPAAATERPDDRGGERHDGGGGDRHDGHGDRDDGGDGERHDGEARADDDDDASAGDELVEAAPPPFSEGIFPCSQCHTGDGDRTRRELGFHDDVQARFAHAPSRRWCLDCHDFERRDVLHLSGGERVPFTESYALCGQCHHHKYRDWRLGIHGKRVGSWEGQKTYLLCVSCHDPHSPRIEPIQPERRPRRPRETRP